MDSHVSLKFNIVRKSDYISEISKTQVYIVKDIDKVSVKLTTQVPNQYLNHSIGLLGSL